MWLKKIAKGFGVGIILGVPLLIAAAIALFLIFYLGLVVLGYMGLLS
jgi:hypothetical protein